MNKPSFRLIDLENSTSQIDMETLETPRLISLLKLHLQKSDFDIMESILIERDKSFSETLTLKEGEKFELERKCAELEEQLGQKQREVDDYKIALKNLELELVSREMECKELRARVSHFEKERGVIEISDSENVDVNSCKDLNFLKKDKGIVEKGEDFVLIPTPKRKWASRMVASESDDDEDDIPIGKLKKERHEEVNEEKQELNDGDDYDDDVPIGKLREKRLISNIGKQSDKTPSQTRRRLVKLGESGSFPKALVSQNQSHSQTNIKSIARCQKLVFLDEGDAEEEDVDDSASEDESLSGFIVDESDDYVGSESSSCYISQENSDSDVKLDDVLATLRRKKDSKVWHYEADMLASFAEDPEICLKAVCALYRQQTLEEQSVKGTFVANNRGFNQCDAYRASMVAEFLLDGDSHGPLKKSVEEFEKQYPDGIEYCRKIADRYSKQLFTIYQQQEDPFLFPS